MENKQKEIITKIQAMRSMALTVLLALEAENTNGKQFDYCTDPQLSDNFDALNRTIKQIDQIIYQNN
jgi:hypothetical protein